MTGLNALTILTGLGVTVTYDEARDELVLEPKGNATKRVVETARRYKPMIVEVLTQRARSTRPEARTVGVDTVVEPLQNPVVEAPRESVKPPTGHSVFDRMRAGGGW